MRVNTSLFVFCGCKDTGINSIFRLENGQRRLKNRHNRGLFCRKRRIFAVMKEKKKIRISFFLSIVFVFLLPTWVSGQELHFTNMSIPGASSVQAIAQDHDGMMWLGTDQGLFSFDGYHMISHYILGDKDQNSWVHSLYVQGDSIFVGTARGILLYNIRKACYEPLEAKALTDVRAILPEGRSLLLGTTDGVYRLSLSSSSLTMVAGNVGSVYALAQTKDGVFVGTTKEAFLLRKSGHVLSMDVGDRLVNSLLIDPLRRGVWFGCEGMLLFKGSGVQQTLPGLEGNSIKTMTENGGTLFVGTDNGLYVQAHERPLIRYSHDSRQTSSLLNNIVWASFTDRDGNVWLGTDRGLSLIPQQNTYKWIPLSAVTGNGEGNCIHDTFVDSYGDSWLGGTDGLIRYHAEKGHFIDVTWYRQNDPVRYLSHNRVRKIYEDRDGDLWVCTDHGIDLYNRQTRTFKNIILTNPRQPSLSTTWAYDIILDHQHRLWVASYLGGIAIVDKQKVMNSSKIFVAADYWMTPSRGLSGLHVGQLAQDRRGHVYASLFDHGIDCINSRTFAVSHLGTQQTYSYILVDHKDRLWAGYAGGVVCFPGPHQSGKDYPFHDKTTAGHVSTMVEVDGHIWAFAGRIGRILGSKGRNSTFALPDFEILAAHVDSRQHRVCLAGNDGFYLVDPHRIEAPGWTSPFLLSGLIVNGHSWPGDGKTSVRYLREVTLPYDENDLDFLLSDLPYEGRPSSLFIYQLANFDKDWKNMPLDGRLSYSGLAPGHYTLTVCSVDGQGNRGAVVYQLKVHILPPWYLSWWADLFYTLFVVGFVGSILVYMRTRRRLRQEQEERRKTLDEIHQRKSYYARVSAEMKDRLKANDLPALAALIHDKLDEGEGTMPVIPMKSVSENSVGVPAPTPFEQRLLEEVHKTVQAHMEDSEFNVTSLSEEIGYGSKQLYRKLKQLTGKTPVEYIRDMRMQRAAELLRQGKYTITETMYLVGFSNSGYFSRCFQKAFGMTPSEYCKSKEVKK